MFETIFFKVMAADAPKSDTSASFAPVREPAPQLGKNKTCGKCQKPANMTCGRCKLVKYCDVNCQRDDWHRYHNKFCHPINSVETALAFVQNFSNMIDEEQRDLEQTYLFGTFTKVIPVLQKYLRNDQIVIANPQFNLMVQCVFALLK